MKPIKNNKNIGVAYLMLTSVSAVFVGAIFLTTAQYNAWGEWMNMFVFMYQHPLEAVLGFFGGLAIAVCIGLMAFAIVSEGKMADFFNK